MNNGDGSRVFNIDDGNIAQLARRFDQRPDAHRRRRQRPAAERSSSRENLTVTDSTISGNSAVSIGGGIGIYGGSTLTVTDSTISGNSAGSAMAAALDSFGMAT